MRLAHLDDGAVCALKYIYCNLDTDAIRESVCSQMKVIIVIGSLNCPWSAAAVCLCLCSPGRV